MTEQCVSDWMRILPDCDKGSNSLAATEMEGDSGSPFLESPQLRGCGKHLDMGVLNTVAYRARQGQVLDDEICARMFAQSSCGVGLEGNADPGTQPQGRSKRDCLCAFVRSCRATSNVSD